MFAEKTRIIRATRSARMVPKLVRSSSELATRREASTWESQITVSLSLPAILQVKGTCNLEKSPVGSTGFTGGSSSSMSWQVQDSAQPELDVQLKNCPHLDKRRFNKKLGRDFGQAA